MKFSEHQKKWIGLINNNSVSSINDFITNCILLKNITYDQNAELSGIVTIRNGEKIEVIVNPDDFIKVIYEFIQLVKNLEKNGYVCIHNTGYEDERRKLVINNDGKIEIAEKEIRFLQKNSDIRILPFQELSDLIENNYLDANELELYHERKERKKAEKITVTIAVLSIILSIISTIGGLVFNYLSYNTKNEVYVKEMVFDKPIEVELK